MSRHNQYTVTVEFFDGFKTSRDLIDHAELTRYVNEGVAMWNCRSILIVHHPYPES